jgi:DNA repair exonuclease SbcCD ATPase subunit
VVIYNETKREKEGIERSIAAAEKQNAVVQANIDSTEKKLEELRNTKGNPYTEQFIILDRKKSEWDAKRFSLEDELIRLKDDLAYVDFWVNGFGKSGIPNMKVEGFLSSLEDKTNYYLSQLTDKMSVSISSVKELKSGNSKEAISYLINSRDSDVHDYHSFSGGERQRIKLADLLAFSSLLGKFNIMILDEVLELSLDENGKNDVIDLLKKEMGSIFIITHSDVMRDKIDNVIKVRKINGSSEIC